MSSVSRRTKHQMTHQPTFGQMSHRSSSALGFCRGPSTLMFGWHGQISPGELLCPVWSYLTDVVVDGVRVPLAHGVAHGVKHAVFVGVDLRHRHVYTVRVVVRSLCSVRWNGLGGNTRTVVNCCSVTDCIIHQLGRCSLGPTYILYAELGDPYFEIQLHIQHMT